MCEELEFYQSWNPYLTVTEAIIHLREEVEKLSIIPNGWQSGEVVTNVFLLSCGLLNCIDEYLSGARLRLPRRLAATVVGRAAGRIVESMSVGPWSRRRVEHWRENWLETLNDFLLLTVRRLAVELKSLAEVGRELTRQLKSPLPSDLQGKRIGPPNPFSRLDLTPADLLALGDFFVRRCPDRTRPILIVGLRTSGSYFAPLLRALLEAQGYGQVRMLTIEPNNGASQREKRDLQRFAARRYLPLIVDDPPALKPYGSRRFGRG